jgi:hypothetical protein
MTTDIPSGSQFPDLSKANLNKKVEDIIKDITDRDAEFFQLAQDKKEDLNKQRDVDLQSFWQSQAGAIERGNSNACNNRNLLDRVRANQNKKVEPIILPVSIERRPYGNGKKQTKLPKTRTSSPTRGNRSRPPSLLVVPVNYHTLTRNG